MSDSATPWTGACQAPLSMGFSRQEYWSGLPCPLPGDLLNPEIESVSLTSLALAGSFFTTSATWEAPLSYTLEIFLKFVIFLLILLSVLLYRCLLLYFSVTNIIISLFLDFIIFRMIFPPKIIR